MGEAQFHQGDGFVARKDVKAALLHEILDLFDLFPASLQGFGHIRGIEVDEAILDINLLAVDADGLELEASFRRPNQNQEFRNLVAAFQVDNPLISPRADF